MPIHYRDAGLADRATMTGIRAMLKLAPALSGGPEARPGYDEMLSKLEKAEGVSFEAGMVGGVPGWWCRRTEPTDAVILYLHGGAYVVGAAWAYRGFVSQIVARSGVSAFIADYSLGPERQFPAGFDDAVSVYRDMASVFGRIALVGDSAGGGLALAVASHVAHDPALASSRQPSGVVLMSPWTDLSLSGASISEKEGHDPLLTAELLATAASNYLGETSALDPRASPLFADLTGLPPLLIHVGTDEILLDDSVRVSERIETGGGDAQLVIWHHMAHVFPFQFGVMTSSRDALDELGRFLAAKLHDRMYESGLDQGSLDTRSR